MRVKGLTHGFRCDSDGIPSEYKLTPSFHIMSLKNCLSLSYIYFLYTYTLSFDSIKHNVPPISCQDHQKNV